MRGTYSGSLTHLQGKTALLRLPPEKGFVLAQFDDQTLTRSGRPMPQLTVLDYEPHARFPTEQKKDYPEPPQDALGFGWHVFRKTEFSIEEEA